MRTYLLALALSAFAATPALADVTSAGASAEPPQSTTTRSIPLAGIICVLP